MDAEHGKNRPTHQEVHADIGGNVSGQMVVGSHNLIIGVRGGSSVNVRSGPPPAVHRREAPLSTLPRRGTEPLGRENELAAINAALADGVPVQVFGSFGSGRSSLLRWIAHRYQAGTVLYLSGAGTSVNDILQDLFDAFFETEDYQPDRPRLRRLMGQVRALLVVDDFDGTAEDLDILLDAAPACDLLVASIQRTMWSVGHAVPVQGLPQEASLELLTRELGRELHAGERATAIEICRSVDGRPLMLVQLAAAVRSAGGALADYRTTEAAAAVFADHLGEHARSVLGTLATLTGVACPKGLLVAALGTEPVTNGLMELTRCGLVCTSSAGYSLAGDLAERVAELAAGSASAGDLAIKLSAWVAANPGRRALADAAPCVVRALRAAVDAGSFHEAIALARVAAPAVARTLRLGAWGNLLELGRSAARAASAADDEAYFAHEVGIRLATLGKAAAVGAALGSAAGLWTRTGDLHTGTAGQHTATAEASTSGTPPSTGTTAGRPPGAGHTVRVLVTKPVVIAITVAAAVAGGVAVANSSDSTSDSPSLSTVDSSTRPTSGFPSTTATAPTTEPTTEPAGETTPELTTVETLAEEPPPPPTTAVPPPCVPQGDPLDFGTVNSGTSTKLSHTFHSDPCHTNGLDGRHSTLRGRNPSAFQLIVESCPAVVTLDNECTLTITFRPAAPGDYQAELFIPEAGPANEQHGHGSLELIGTAAP